ncbi:uncharacterized protein LOC133885122 [Phragmites australis]|uniref:uncharacterized protein LOC133885122 n=1 Tax=Phragmites australis TaxID=29695 RepID=UPI002D76D1A0|nr:uncharacterized protein LOC133885122 [Phragmites australis]
MPMAPAATRSSPSLLANAKSGFLVSSPYAAATAVRLARRAGGDRTVLLGVAPRSGRRDGWGADSNSSSGGGLVDEDMATLRRRIREVRAALSKDDTDADAGGLPLPAAEWTELERRHHGSYVAGVRGAAGLLEAFLVSARPGLGAGVVALLLLGVPASLLLVCAQLITAVGSVSSSVLNGQ